MKMKIDLTNRKVQIWRKIHLNHIALVSALFYASVSGFSGLAYGQDNPAAAINEYKTILTQTDSTTLFLSKLDLDLKSQALKKNVLLEQIAKTPANRKAVIPMMLRMAAELERSVEEDMPFLLTQRREDIQNLKKILAAPDALPGEQYTQLLKAYKREVEYGKILHAYEGPHPNKAGQRVDFLGFGRIALLYMSKNEKDIGYYHLDESGKASSWKPLRTKNALAIRQAIRVARSEAAPELVLAPVNITQ